MTNIRTGFHRMGIVIGIALSFSWIVYVTYATRFFSENMPPEGWTFIVIILLAVFLIGYGIFAGIPWIVCWIIEGFKKERK